MQQAEEDLLVIAAQGGNQKAFQLLFNRYQKALLRFAYKICGDTELANDATQDAWIKTAKEIRKIQDPRVFKSWIYRLVRWRCLDQMRQQGVRNKYFESIEDIDYVDKIENVVDQSEELSAAIERMPPMEKQMIHLFYLDELKVAEIASVLDIPTGTVKSRLNRARKLLKQKFDIV